MNEPANTNTALIVRPDEPDTLETHGPMGNGDLNVHHDIGFFLSLTMSFDEWRSGRPDAPRRKMRSPRPRHDYQIEQDETRRMVALLNVLEGFYPLTIYPLARRHIREIRQRIITLHPLY